MRSYSLAILVGIFALTSTTSAGEPKRDNLRNWLETQRSQLLTESKTTDKLAAIKEIEELWSTPGACAQALVGAMRDPDREVRLAAARTFVKLGPLAADKIRSLLPFLDPRDPCGDDDELRFELLLAIQQMGSAPYGPFLEIEHDTIPILVGMLHHKSARIRAMAAQAIGAAGLYGREAVPDLIQTLDHPGDGSEESQLSVRAGVILAIGNVGASSAPAVPKLLEILRSSPRLQGLAIGALAGIGTTHADVVPTLISLMKNSSVPGQRAFAAQNLGRIGSAAKDATPALLEVLKQKQAVVKDRAVFGLHFVVLQMQHREVQRQALYALGSMRPAAQSAVPTLTEFAANRQIPTELRVAALKSLERFGPTAKAAVPDLVKMLKDQDPPYDVVAVLVAIGKDAVPPLIEFIKNGEGISAKKALWALARIGPDAASAREAIAGLITHPELGDTAKAVLAHLDKFRSK